MVTSTKESAVHGVDLLDGVSASVDGRVLSIKGPLGTVRKNFHKIHVNIGVDSGKVQITSFTGKKIVNLQLQATQGVRLANGAAGPADVLPPALALEMFAEAVRQIWPQWWMKRARASIA